VWSITYVVCARSWNAAFDAFQRRAPLRSRSLAVAHRSLHGATTADDGRSQANRDAAVCSAGCRRTARRATVCSPGRTLINRRTVHPSTVIIVARAHGRLLGVSQAPQESVT